MNELEFINKIKDASIDVQAQHGIYASISMAQAILESGWGTSALAQKYCNLYGIKALRDWTGKVTNVDTREWTKDEIVTINQPFRVYSSWTESILDHAKFLQKEWYIAAGVFKARNFKKQIEAIFNGGYSSDPNYITKILKLINDYDLKKYDMEGSNNMKIAVRGGHNFAAPGASGIISETVEDRKVKDAIIKYLTQRGVLVLDVTPGDMSQKQDLKYGINKAENWGADMFISIHFNNAYKKYFGAIGTEVILKQGSPMLTTAKRVNNKLVDLGFKRHGDGITYNQHLYELNHFNSAMIIEVCFVESTTDVATYKNVGSDSIGKAIVEGIFDIKINNSNTSNNTSNNSNSLDSSMAICTGNGVRIRSSMDTTTNTNILGSLNKNDTVKIFKKIGDWYSIYYGNHGGYVSAAYISLI
ncbi:glucosaminidase domain-containing protein [Clostridium botulinum]|uniref:glucosaminidase domain-containing protein n=1 Tax=Clostridium botulinum TaxID=1491 RepID=UPI001E5B06A8|nr:glucosaminidase domain-containing protein [Clostridium botulinum]MCD3202821.1 SH3 domain-containing protein [Clostridium botulinum C/D]MCD3230891.1 SH3 domain-containing protein [Clostridium botulinum C/D]MCD3253923.1 SH3 domain-containing protein [Clostridium botulinum C/D]MCD3279481.1 SH3 domain-containing protein [Clostridium botulinum C/D]MCD3281626.1 SH3 domain-containing protein [Clostridium botulinum C/D]